MTPASTVMTVTGPVAADDLGVTLPHEHVFLDLTQEYRGDGLLNDPALAEAELRRYADAGGRTLVDVTSGGLRGDPVGAARRCPSAPGCTSSGGAASTGRAYFPPELDELSTDAVADLIVRDIEEGIDGVRAGIIGEIGCDRFISAVEERSFRAAARAHRRTGLTITTHAARWPVGTDQLDLLVEEGVDPGRVVIGHCDMVPDDDYHRPSPSAGAWVQFDTVQGSQRVRHPPAARLDAGAWRTRATSTRCCSARTSACAPTTRPWAGRATPTSSPRSLTCSRAEGFDDADLSRLLVDNPRRMLTGE